MRQGSSHIPAHIIIVTNAGENLIFFFCAFWGERTPRTPRKEMSLIPEWAGCGIRSSDHIAIHSSELDWL